MLLFAFVEVQVGGGQIQIEQVLASSEMKGSGRSVHPLPLQENVGHVFAAERFKGDGVLNGSGDLVWPIDFAQGNNLLDVMESVEPFVLELAIEQLGRRAEVEEG